MNPLFLLLGLLSSLPLMSRSGDEPTATDKSTGLENDQEEDIVEDDVDEAGNDDDSVPPAPSAVSDDEEETIVEDHSGHDDMAEDNVTEHHSGHSHDDAHTSNPEITPPGVGASQSAINAFVSALSGASEVHSHDAGSDLHSEHNAAMALVDRGEATHVAIGDGDWDDPNIWSNGQVPGDNAKVLIPDGVTVDYGYFSDARLFTVRVDGKIDFATNTDSQMIFDTFVVSPTGYLEMGTANDPVDADVTIDLIVANNGQIDTDWDPNLLSRGLISHGKTVIHGAEKDSHEKVTDDPMAGDKSIKFNGVPDGWQVGDKIVIAGTHYDGYAWDHDLRAHTERENEDETRTISQIDDDGRVWFDEPLTHDHDSPRADLKTSVANYTRNVSIETEGAEDAEIYERGHVMFMHSDDVDVRYMEFHELGRTDKSEDSANVDDFGSLRFDSNVQGRYSVHLHRTGTNSTDDPAILEGNTVYGSPGWGFVHHDSHAELSNNASYATFGAGFVAETGNETGTWEDNIAIYARGVDWGILKNTTNVDNDTFDTARGGEGFWFQGRMVASTDNIAASVNTGFAYFHRDGNDTMIPIDADQFAYPSALNYIEVNKADMAPILEFSGNETFAAKEGLHIVKANPNQSHDVHSHLNDFTAWSVVNGAHLQYTAHYILTDFDVVGREDGDFWTAKNGILIGDKTSDLTIVNPTIDGFSTGINLNKDFKDGTPKDLHSYSVIDADIRNADVEFKNYDARYDTITNSNNLPGYNPKLDLSGGKLIWSGGEINPTGTKYDTLGETPYPGGNDAYRIYGKSINALLENVGYWETSDGENYTLVDFYFTDRVTGEVYYETQPLYLNVNLNTQSYKDAVNNGVQNISTVNGMKMAGDYALDVTIEAVPADSSNSATLSAMPEMAALTLSTMPEIDTALDDTFGLEIRDGDLFVNTTDATDMDLTVSGGTAVLATGGAEFDLSDSRTLAVFEAAAKVGFDGENGGIALLDMHEGSTVAFAAEDGDLATIEEISTGVYGSEPDVLSGIDLGNTTLSIDLSGLTADAGTAFTLMDADEIVGIFDEATIGGLGARNAKIIVDYEADSVSLELSAGEGAVEVETLGLETSVTSGEEAVWAALTAGQGIHNDHNMGDNGDDMDDDPMNVAA